MVAVTAAAMTFSSGCDPLLSTPRRSTTARRAAGPGMLARYSAHHEPFYRALRAHRITL
jgi:hypothetical protein